mmetsp:Transcript_121058/g.347823  ORF Transcript_121058/g.347823 Transcript_121058/m.347823 type:complete len:134 (+) Transcript_121058:88-489(+)
MKFLHFILQILCTVTIFPLLTLLLTRRTLFRMVTGLLFHHKYGRRFHGCPWRQIPVHPISRVGVVSAKLNFNFSNQIVFVCCPYMRHLPHRGKLGCRVVPLVIFLLWKNGHLRDLNPFTICITNRQKRVQGVL